MELTPNYNLKKPGYADLVDIEIINENTNKIDKILNDKVDKTPGKTLSSNDYTDGDKKKVTSIPDDPKYTDTLYDDSKLVERVERVEATAGGLAGKYEKPSTGIPSSDLSQSVQTSLTKADSALQEHQDVRRFDEHIASASLHVTNGDKARWDAKAERNDIPTDERIGEIARASQGVDGMTIFNKDGSITTTSADGTTETTTFGEKQIVKITKKGNIIVEKCTTTFKNDGSIEVKYTKGGN